MKLKKCRKKTKVILFCFLFFIVGVIFCSGSILFQKTFHFAVDDIYFAYYVDGIMTSSMPVQNSGYTLDTTKSSCNHGVSFAWDASEGVSKRIFRILLQQTIQEQDVIYIL